jgi:hypothetical protein
LKTNNNSSIYTTPFEWQYQAVVNELKCELKQNESNVIRPSTFSESPDEWQHGFRLYASVQHEGAMLKRNDQSSTSLEQIRTSICLGFFFAKRRCVVDSSFSWFTVSRTNCIVYVERQRQSSTRDFDGWSSRMPIGIQLKILHVTSDNILLRTL